MKSHTFWMTQAQRWNNIPESKSTPKPKPNMGFPYAWRACFTILDAWKKAGEVRTETPNGTIITTENYSFGCSRFPRN